MLEIIIILIVAVLVLGPDKLPEFIVQVARIFKFFKQNLDEAKASIEKEIRLSDLKNEAKKYQDEINNAGENIRKKLSFEEFDELKNQAKNALNLDSNAEKKPQKSGEKNDA